MVATEGGSGSVSGPRQSSRFRSLRVTSIAARQSSSGRCHRERCLFVQCRERLHVVKGRVCRVVIVWACGEYSKHFLFIQQLNNVPVSCVSVLFLVFPVFPAVSVVFIFHLFLSLLGINPRPIGRFN